MTNFSVIECFTSIQGEGSRAGRLSDFIRVTGCNLRCKWCDTAYALKNPTIKWTLEGIFNHIDNSKAKDLVITGGEPFLQKDLLSALIERYSATRFITIETNGTIGDLKEIAYVDLISISPKLSTSNTVEPEGQHWYSHEEKRINLDILNWLVDSSVEYQLKFVVGFESDILEIHDLLLKIPNHDSEAVWLMPQGQVRDELDYKRQWVVEQCQRYGWNYSDRLQVVIWNDKKGV